MVFSLEHYVSHDMIVFRSNLLVARVLLAGCAAMAAQIWLGSIPCILMEEDVRAELLRHGLEPQVVKMRHRGNGEDIAQTIV